MVLLLFFFCSTVKCWFEYYHWISACHSLWTDFAFFYLVKEDLDLHECSFIPSIYYYCHFLNELKNKCKSLIETYRPLKICIFIVNLTKEILSNIQFLVYVADPKYMSCKEISSKQQEIKTQTGIDVPDFFFRGGVKQTP